MKNEEIQDKILVCLDCGNEFIFSKGEQCYFLSRELLPPKRCPACRKKRRDAIRISKGVTPND